MFISAVIFFSCVKLPTELKSSIQKWTDMILIIDGCIGICFLAKRFYAQKYADGRNPDKRLFRTLRTIGTTTSGTNFSQKY